jgi:hypothetical protein
MIYMSDDGVFTVITPNRRSAAAIAKAVPEVSRAEGALVITFRDERSARVLRTLTEIAAHVVANLDRGDQLIEMLQPEALPTEAAVVQAKRMAVARTAALERLDPIDSKSVAELAGSQAANRSALGHRWRTEGRVFAIPVRGKTFYPSFQFDDVGQPRPEMADVLAALGRPPGWNAALWFLGENERLGGKAPLDVFGKDPAAVVDAARWESKGLEL